MVNLLRPYNYKKWHFALRKSKLYALRKSKLYALRKSKLPPLVKTTRRRRSYARVVPQDESISNHNATLSLSGEIHKSTWVPCVTHPFRHSTNVPFWPAFRPAKVWHRCGFAEYGMDVASQMLSLYVWPLPFVCWVLWNSVNWKTQEMRRSR